MADNEMKWYVLRATSGKEGKVKEYIDHLVDAGDSQFSNVSRVLIPTDKVVVAKKDNKRGIKEKVRFPGYVFVEAVLDSATQDVLRNRVPNVYGFLCETKGNTKPMPLSEQEANQMLGANLEEEPVIDEVVLFSIGESVKVCDGPFNGFDAIIQEINTEKKRLTVEVKIFGRKTPVELGFAQVEKQ